MIKKILLIVLVCSISSLCYAGNIELGPKSDLKDGAAVYSTAYYDNSLLSDFLYPSTDNSWVSESGFYEDYLIAWEGEMIESPWPENVKLTIYKLNSGQQGEKIFESSDYGEPDYMSVYGDYLFLLYNYSPFNMRIFNLSSLPALTEINSWDSSLIKVTDDHNDIHATSAIGGKYFYKSDGEKINVYDISDPAEPVEVASKTVDDAMASITVFRLIGDRMYVLWAKKVENYPYVLSVFKINNGTHINFLGEYDFDDSLYLVDLQIKNGYAYLAGTKNIHSPVLVALDVSDPSKIKKINENTDFPDNTNGSSNSIDFLSDNVALMVQSNNYFSTGYYTSNATMLYFLDISSTADIKVLSVSWGSPRITNIYKDYILNTGLHVECYGSPFQAYCTVESLSGLSKVNLDLGETAQAELLGFKTSANKKSVKIKWDTLREEQVKNFLVVKKLFKANAGSTNKNQTATGKTLLSKKIKPAGSNTNGSTYEFTDKKVKKNNRYQYELYYIDENNQQHILRTTEVKTGK